MLAQAQGYNAVVGVQVQSNNKQLHAPLSVKGNRRKRERRKREREIEHRKLRFSHTLWPRVPSEREKKEREMEAMRLALPMSKQESLQL